MILHDAQFAQAREYLHHLDALQPARWLSALEDVLAQPGATPKAYALMHPVWLDLMFHSVVASHLRGSDRFSQDRLDAHLGSCNAQLIWGYRCELASTGPLEADHLFPRSLGGASAIGNRVWLCRLHNQLKSNDVHLYPNWTEWRPWLKQGLEARRSAAQRR